MINTCKNKNSILLICVYMGELPFWMPAFLISCQKNYDIQWLIVSNSKIPNELPVNVRFVHMDIDKFNKNVFNSLSINVNIKSNYAYKICDLKIAFGNIFKKEISDFSFWGFCDLDIIWGSIRNFVTNEILQNYDIITSRENRISGHFCLFRNDNNINDIYKKVKGFEIMAKDYKRCYGIDENHFTDRLKCFSKFLYLEKIKKLLNNKAVHPKVYWKEVLTTSGAHQRALGEGVTQSFLWKDGKVFDTDRKKEFMYIHFHKMKQNMDMINFLYQDMPSSFIINKKGFFVDK